MNTPSTKIALALLTEVSFYFRSSFLVPMVALYGATILFVLFTLLSFLPVGSSPQAVPPLEQPVKSILINEKTLLQAWGLITLLWYGIRRFFELVTHRTWSASYRKKIFIQLIALTVMDGFLIIAAALRAGWFDKGDNVVPFFVLLYLVTVIITLLSWLFITPFDFLIRFLHTQK